MTGGQLDRDQIVTRALVIGAGDLLALVLLVTIFLPRWATLEDWQRWLFYGLAFAYAVWLTISSRWLVRDLRALLQGEQ